MFSEKNEYSFIRANEYCSDNKALNIDSFHVIINVTDKAHFILFSLPLLYIFSLNYISPVIESCLFSAH